MKHFKAKVDSNRLVRMLYEYEGLLQTKAKVPIHDNKMLSIVYSPGVGQVNKKKKMKMKKLI